MRMSPESFQYLLNVIGSEISKKDTKFRKAISASERLCLILHYLAYGGSQQSLSFSFRIAKSTISSIVNETCSAIWNCLKEQYLRPPKALDEWKKIAQDFNDMWDLPHCIGAIDGKHIRMKAPINSGSLYYNYKGFFSIILMAICDARYVFSFVDIGDYGSNNDSGVFRRSAIGKSFFKKEKNLPEPENIENSPTFGLMPYYLVGDDAFPLQQWLIKPYPGQGIRENQLNFNYRLSRARRVIENAFGILAARWRVFMNPLQTNVNNAETIVKVTICLHNFLRRTNSAAYCPSGFVDSWDDKGEIKEGEWRRLVADGNSSLLIDIPPIRGSRPSNTAVNVRDNLKSYVNSMEGSLPWQWEHV
ncbi:uncharacterized protein LOC130625697 [Hydractinia symbiolongicarpus]|uniref:uncharacterized protein LOC130625697 n=1 Tax=Hydractinia symbiolongicarpus TaxID=13093 RepID=UPI00254B2B98|nr:uncharacterized protein LOC130625697 [Hydractinia symbiolongicarpus]